MQESPGTPSRLGTSRCTSWRVAVEEQAIQEVRDKPRTIQRCNQRPNDEAGQSVSSPRAPRTASRSWQLERTGTPGNQQAYIALDWSQMWTTTGVSGLRAAACTAARNR